MNFARLARARLARGAASVCALPAIVCALSCGRPPPPPQAPASAVPVASAAAPPALDLSAVPDPRGLFVTATVAKPSALLATVQSWSGQPALQSDEVSEQLIGEAVGPIVDLAQPMYVAVRFDERDSEQRIHPAVSAALVDVDRAKATLGERFKLVSAPDGVVRLRPLDRRARDDRNADDAGTGESSAADDDETDAGSCELAPSFGSPALRLVCAAEAEDLPDLGAWLSRTAPRAPIRSDVHLEVRMRPLHKVLSVDARMFLGLLGAELASAAPDVPSASQLVSGAFEDVVDFGLDLRRASIDVRLADEAAAIDATLALGSTTSAIARWITFAPDRNGPAPDAFQRLPADADVALFGRGVDGGDFAHMRDRMLRVFDEVLAAGALQEADRKPIVSALGAMLSASPGAYASGIDVDAVGKALTAERAARDTSDDAARASAWRAAVEALFGWRLAEVDEPAARVTGGLRDLAAALGRPGVVAAARAAGRRGLPPPTLRAAPVPKGSSLPSGTQRFVIDWQPPGPAAGSSAAPAKARPARLGPPVSFDVLVVPDGPRTWIGLGAGDALASKIAAALAPGGDKLAGRPDLASFEAGPIGAGGFFSLRSLLEVVLLGNELAGESQDPLAAFDAIGQLPHHASGRLTYSLTPGSDAGAPTARLSLGVPRVLVEDVVDAIVHDRLGP